MNEIILIASLPIIYGSVCLAYRFFGKGGIYAFISIATILANIEVLLLVKAFGITQTLGNILFASVYLCTDILSENEGKESAKKGVLIGLFSSVFMVAVTSSWIFYKAENPDIFSAFKTLFSATPRVILASLLAYGVSQALDVFLYHRFWKTTAEKTGSTRKFLWLRNNSATLISQVVNTAVFSLAAFYGVYDGKTLITIMISSYLIYIATSLADTPFVYLARRIKDKSK